MMMVSMLMTRILLDACGRRGVAARALLTGSGVQVEQLLEGNARMPSEQFERICQRALSLTHNPALGLELGARLPPQALQVVGYLLASAPTLRSAYAAFERYAVLLADAPSWALSEERDQASFKFSCFVPHPHTQRMANDWSIALAARIVAAYAPASSLDATCAGFAHAQPDDLRPYRELFGASVRFAQRENTFSFPRAWLDLPQLHGDASTCAGLSELAERMLADVDQQFSLSANLRRMLGRESSLAQLSVRELARRSALSESALRRRLASEGTSPSQLIDEARRRIACAELARGERCVKQLASELGYAELRSFHRAFKRWTGQTPASYRAQGARLAAGAR